MRRPASCAEDQVPVKSEVGSVPNPVWYAQEGMLALSGAGKPETLLPFPSWTLVTLSQALLPLLEMCRSQIPGDTERGCGEG